MAQQDHWDVLLREFVTNNTTLDLRKKEITSLSPKMWTMYPLLHTVDLSQNSGLVIPEEFGSLKNLKTLRLEQCNLSQLPFSILQLDNLYTLDLSKNEFASFYEVNS